MKYQITVQAPDGRIYHNVEEVKDLPRYFDARIRATPDHTVLAMILLPEDSK